MMKRNSFILFSLFICISATSFAQLAPIYDSIPVENNLKLAATLYKPSGCTQCPTILVQTPYNRLYYNIIGLPLGIGMNINAAHYNVVIVDWRGFYGSAGAAHVGAPNTGQDGYTIVEWIAAQPWSDGQVGTWGPSALGKCQFMTEEYHPPHLKCMVPLVSGSQYTYAEYFPGGVYRTEYVEQLDALGFGLSTTLLSNPFYNLAWQYTEGTTYYPDSIAVPTFMIGGWYDHNTKDILNLFNGIRTGSPVPVRNQHRLLMGPWVHGGSGYAQVGSVAQGDLSYPNAAGWNDSLALLFFDYHLRGIANGWNATPFVQYYQMGDDAWQSTAVWPPAGVSDYHFYLHNDQSMDTYLPANSTGSLSYTYDPQNPSPTEGGCTLRPDLDQGPYDQQTVVESRNDLLVFSTAALSHDVVMKGVATAHLKVSSDKKDTDFSIRLTDVYPDGRSELLVDGITRMRFRNGYTTADTASMVPGTMYDCTITMPATCITFKAGHKIRVDVSSSNYPKYNRNDNSGGVMYPAHNGDSLANPQVAINTVYTNITNASYITLPINSFIDGMEEPAGESFSIYPNPAAGYTQLSFYMPADGEIDITVTDLSGKKVFATRQQYQAGASQYVLNTGSMVAGVYLVTLQGAHLSGTTKLIVP